MTAVPARKEGKATLRKDLAGGRYFSMKVWLLSLLLSSIIGAVSSASSFLFIPKRYSEVDEEDFIRLDSEIMSCWLWLFLVLVILLPADRVV